MVIRGVHAADKADFATIAIPINAVVYAGVIFGLLCIFDRKRNSV
jgi:hypothetical protein